MRESLKRSAAHSPDRRFERYPKGSIVLCQACARPVFKLDATVTLGAKCGQMARAFKPVSVLDLVALADREDIDVGVLAFVRALTPEMMQAHVDTLREMRTGDPMLCPSCNDCFVQVTSTERNEALDRSYVVELLTIPPSGVGAPIRGKYLGVKKEWLD